MLFVDKFTQGLNHRTTSRRRKQTIRVPNPLSSYLYNMFCSLKSAIAQHLERFPVDPYEQLDLARKITSIAIASRVSKLESETGRLRQKLLEKDRFVADLQEKVSQLEQASRESNSRLSSALEENTKLSKERDSLATTAKKLSRDLAKLETFKRQLMQSLNDDNLSQAETVDIETCDQSVVKSYSVKDEEVNDYKVSKPFNGSTEVGNPNQDDPRHAGERFSMTPYITPRFTPNRTPWYPPSQQSSAASSPPRGPPLPGRSPRIDGKEFFRQARNRLSYEQFSAFLVNIKELNAQKQSREETLKKAEEIFGSDNRDLYQSFQVLLNRNRN